MQLSLLDSDESTSLPADSPARTSAQQESERALRALDPASGPRCSELSSQHDRIGSLLRMFLGLELSAQTGCSLTWQKQATPHGRSWWVLSMPERHTDDKESGFWRRVTTTCGKTALVDESDAELVLRHRWRVLPNGYVYTKMFGRTVMLHRFLMSADPGMDVDHINHDPLDNRRANLRVVPHWENTHNRKKAGGVHQQKGRTRWKAIIYVNNVRHYLGSFLTEEEARAAYLSAKKRLVPPLLPTPSAVTYGSNRGGQDANSPTGWSRDAPERPSLDTMARKGLLPTPNCKDADGGTRKGTGQIQLCHQFTNPTGAAGPMRLNPLFVQWMMGYPPDWLQGVECKSSKRSATR